MVGIIEKRRQQLKDEVERITRKNGSDKITIPVYDFIIFMECLEQVCSEYAGAREIEELYIPVENKYYNLWSVEE